MNAFNANQLQLILLRPGATDLDEQGRITGSLDISLSANGKKQAQRSSAEIANVTIDRIYSAPGSAASETLQQLAQFKHSKIRVDENLRNVNHGLWHGKLVKELKENQPKLFRQWQENPELVHPPGGETIDEVRARINRVIKQITRKHKAGTVMVVAAEPIAGMILCELEGSDLQTRWQTNGRFAEWTWVRSKDGASVAS